MLHPCVRKPATTGRPSPSAYSCDACVSVPASPNRSLAERAGGTPHAVSALERGTRTRPYPHTVRSLAEAFGASDAERAALIAAVPSRRAVGAAKPAGLVVPPTHLYGREHDIAAIAKLARSGEARLITLTGPGGVGKTRLVAALSEGLAEDYSDGVVQISLAPQVGRLSASCPEVTVLVSSRSPLRVRAEREYAVEPLELPACDAATADQLGQAAAGALILDRVRAVAPQHPARAARAPA